VIQSDFAPAIYADLFFSHHQQRIALRRQISSNRWHGASLASLVCGACLTIICIVTIVVYGPEYRQMRLCLGMCACPMLWSLISVVANFVTGHKIQIYRW